MSSQFWRQVFQQLKGTQTIELLFATSHQLATLIKFIKNKFFENICKNHKKPQASESKRFEQSDFEANLTTPA